MPTKQKPDVTELLSAYRDGVTELTPDERRAVEAALDANDQLRAEDAQLTPLLSRLRALPPEGAEPDWSAMERSIRLAVGSEVPRSWWRRWTVLAPVTTLVTAMAVLMLVLWGRGMPSVTPTPPQPALSSPQPAHADEAVADAHDSVPLWLDGVVVDVDEAAAANLLPDEASDSVADADDSDESLLPTSDLAWIDRLDGDDLARAEHWLATRKKG